jgi:hypothetical protein
LTALPLNVTPAKAGPIEGRRRAAAFESENHHRIPAFAGMTDEGLGG